MQQQQPCKALCPPIRREKPPAPRRGFLHEQSDAIYAAAIGFLIGAALFVPSLCGITDWTPLPF
jgi:hypothetical protein